MRVGVIHRNTVDSDIYTRGIGTTKADSRSTNTYTDPYKSGNTDLSAGAYLYQTTNELGKTTTYGHHLPTGAQSSVTDANGNKTIYTYDDNYSRLQKVTNGNGGNS